MMLRDGQVAVKGAGLGTRTRHSDSALGTRRSALGGLMAA